MKDKWDDGEYNSSNKFEIDKVSFIYFVLTIANDGACAVHNIIKHFIGLKCTARKLKTKFVI